LGHTGGLVADLSFVEFADGVDNGLRESDAGEEPGDEFRVADAEGGGLDGVDGEFVGGGEVDDFGVGGGEMLTEEDFAEVVAEANEMIHAFVKGVGIAEKKSHDVGDGEGVLPTAECVEAVEFVGWEGSEDADGEGHILDAADADVAGGVFDGGDTSAVGGEGGGVSELEDARGEEGVGVDDADDVGEVGAWRVGEGDDLSDDAGDGFAVGDFVELLEGLFAGEEFGTLRWGSRLICGSDRFGCGPGSGGRCGGRGAGSCGEGGRGG